MRIDEFDNTMVCEDDDIEVTLSYLKDFRRVSEYIEKEIIHIILEEYSIAYTKEESLETKLNRLPQEFLMKTKNDIANMFNNYRKVNYHNIHLSYLIYYLSNNLFKVWKPLIDLHTRSMLKHDMRILDIGTGPGSIPIGIIEFYKELAIKYTHINFKLSFTLIEKEQEFIDIATKLINSIKKYMPNNLNISIEQIHEEIVSENYFREDLGKYDLITMSNILAIGEMDNTNMGPDILQNFKNNVNDDGAIIIINPGDGPNSRELNSIRNKLINNKDFNLYSPCNSIWEDKAKYNCTCFNITRAYWHIPLLLDFLYKKGLGKNLREGVPFSYIVLRTDGLKKHKTESNNQHYIKLKDLKDHHLENVNVSGIIRTVFYKSNSVSLTLCDGSCEFIDENNLVWLSMKNNELKSNNIDIPLISGEKITIRKVEVVAGEKSINLKLNHDSKIRIDY